MPIVDESKQNKGVNNNTRNKQMAIDMEYYNRLNHLRFKSPYLGAKYQQRVIPVRTLNGVQDVFVDNRGTIKQGGHTHSKLYNYSNKNRTHPIKGAYAREVDSWNNNTSPIKALVNSGIGYALAPAAQAIYDQMLLDIQFRKEYLMVRKYIEHKIFGSLILMNISRNGVHMIQTVKLYQD